LCVVRSGKNKKASLEGMSEAFGSSAEADDRGERGPGGGEAAISWNHSQGGGEAAVREVVMRCADESDKRVVGRTPCEKAWTPSMLAGGLSA